MSAPDLDWIEVLGTSSTLPNAGFCTRSLWTATASKNSSTASSGIDGSPSSKWTTGSAQAVGDYYQIDFGGVVKLSDFEIDNSGLTSSDYAGTVGIFTSQDGVTFSTVPADTSTGDVKTVFSMIPETLRAIRIKVIKTASSKPFSVGELRIEDNADGDSGCQL